MLMVHVFLYCEHSFLYEITSSGHIEIMHNTNTISLEDFVKQKLPETMYKQSI